MQPLVSSSLPADFVTEVRELTGLEVVVSDHARGLYSTDASIYQVAPLGVVVPEHIDQIPMLLGLCHKHAIPVLPRGGGTSLAGQCVNQALVIDVSQHCNRLPQIDPGSQQCSVEPGLTIDDLNDALRANGLFFAPDPSTARQANIGGCIGNNAAGVHSVLFGRTSENVIGIKACLADGQTVRFGPGSAAQPGLAMEITTRVVDVVRRYQQHIRERFPKTRRRSSGYQLDVILAQLEANNWDAHRVNLTPLLCGSEGTLAFTLDATLQLQPIPKRKGLAVLSFQSVEHAIDSVSSILTLAPAGVELLDELIMDLARGNTETAAYVSVLPDTSAKAVLFVEFFGDDKAEVDDRLGALSRLLPEVPFARFTDAQSMGAAWKLRKAGEPLLHAIAGERKPLGFVEDNAIPVEHLGEFVRRFRAIVEREGTIASYYAHASVGVLHVRPLLDLRDAHDEQAMHRIASDVADLAIELGGVPSGEHGDGRARGPFIERAFGPELLSAFREIKSIFDPENLLNPANIVEPQAIASISAHTRVRPNAKQTRVEPLETYYQYKPEHGFAHAVELCNGAGVCRRKEGGVMCPSYQATLEERHSTRGRGNALRLAITGQTDLGREPSGSAVLNDPETLKTLDLCLSCKGCKSECPSSVDIAKLKGEYLAQGYREQGGAPLKVRVMSHIHSLNRMGAMFPSLSNAAQAFPPIRSVINHAMGVHPKRSLPEFGRAIRSRAFKENDAPRVLLLSDTFTTHNEPHIARACVSVLGSLGYNVGVQTMSDFGRAAISLGHLEHAVRDANRTIEQLKAAIDDERIVAMLIPEPSCLSAVCDDWADLSLEHDAQLVAKLIAKCALPETFVERFWDRHPHRVGTKPISGSIVLHGHCHQKSLWGDQTSAAIFERLYPDRVRVLPTGCCGMAGAFGYAQHRYDLSMKIGEQSLFPSVRSLSDDDMLIAPGTSCRHQILDGTARRALHPIEALARLIER